MSWTFSARRELKKNREKHVVRERERETNTKGRRKTEKEKEREKTERERRKEKDRGQDKTRERGKKNVLDEIRAATTKRITKLYRVPLILSTRISKISPNDIKL